MHGIEPSAPPDNRRVSAPHKTAIDPSAPRWAAKPTKPHLERPFVDEFQ